MLVSDRRGRPELFQTADPPMKKQALSHAAASLVWCGVVLGGGMVRAGEAQAFKWSVQYLIDQSRSTMGRVQNVFPRCNRGLAISPDGRYLYAGYHQSHEGEGEIRKIDLQMADFDNATVAMLPGPLAKAIAVDQEGRVYVSGESRYERRPDPEKLGVTVYDSELTREIYQIPADDTEGLAVTQEGGRTVLYATERRTRCLKRWVIKTQGAAVTGAELEGLGNNGVLRVSGAASLRGVAVDGKGRIVFADLEGSKVYRVRKDGGDLQSAAVRTPMAVGCEGARYLVTEWRGREISLLDEDLKVVGILHVPWEELELSPFGNNRWGALSGIVMLKDGGFLVSNERGQTACQRSTYGRPDGRAGKIEGRLYTDVFSDDNDPILRAQPVEVGTAGVR
jgi:hypothetical protein